MKKNNRFRHWTKTFSARRELLMIALGCLFVGSCVATSPNREVVNIKSIYLPTFRNLTYEYGIEDYLTNAIINQFIADARLTVTDGDAAELILRGNIYRYVREPVVYNDQDEVQEYSVGLWVDLALYEAGSDTPLWRDNDIYAKTTYSDIVTPIETEAEVQRRLMDDLVIDIADRTLEGWARILK